MLYVAHIRPVPGQPTATNQPSQRFAFPNTQPLNPTHVFRRFSKEKTSVCRVCGMARLEFAKETIGRETVKRLRAVEDCSQVYACCLKHVHVEGL